MGFAARCWILAVLQGLSGSSCAQGRGGWQGPAGGWGPQQERHQCLSSHIVELGPWAGGFAPKVNERAGGDGISQNKVSVFPPRPSPNSAVPHDPSHATSSRQRDAPRPVVKACLYKSTRCLP